MQISFVIVTRDRTDYLIKCIRSIDSHAVKGTEVIIIDNAISDKTEVNVRDLCNELSKVELTYLRVEPHENILSLGRNLGAMMAQNEFVAFVDDDVELHPAWMEAFSETFKLENIGAAGGRIIEPGDELKDPNADLPIGKLLSNGKTTASFYINSGTIVDIDHIRGCNWVINKSLFDKLGGFSNRLRHVFEETDLCFRIKKSGQRIVYNPKMAVDHHCGPRSHILRKRDPSLASLQQRENLAAYVELLLINFGLFSELTLRYLFTTETGLVALVKTLSRQSFEEFINLWRGKLLGICRYLFASSKAVSKLQTVIEFKHKNN